MQQKSNRRLEREEKDKEAGLFILIAICLVVIAIFPLSVISAVICIVVGVVMTSLVRDTQKDRIALGVMVFIACVGVGFGVDYGMGNYIDTAKHAFSSYSFRYGGVKGFFPYFYNNVFISYKVIALNIGVGCILGLISYFVYIKKATGLYNSAGKLNKDYKTGGRKETAPTRALKG